jgi:hypothetical protein
MVHADLSADLLEAIFTPRGALHDGAVIIRGTSILAAGAVLPLAETTLQAERFGTRHRAALGITEQTDALVVVVSEESGQASVVERARIRRNLDEPQLVRAILASMLPEHAAGAALRGRFPSRATGRSIALGPGALRRAALGDRRRAGRRGDDPELVAGEVRDDADHAAAGAGR